MANKGKLANILFFLSLLFIFVFCSFLIVSFQINSYNNIVNQNNLQQNKSLISSYIRNQIRIHDVKDNVHVIQIDDVDVLQLQQNQTVSYIYAYDGYLRELYTVEGYNFDLSQGDKLFQLENMQLSLNGHILNVLVDGEMISISIYSEGG